MNIEIAAICDAATANGIGGRLNILGAFDRVFPAKVDLLASNGVCFLYNSERLREEANKCLERIAWRIALCLPVSNSAMLRGLPHPLPAFGNRHAQVVPFHRRRLRAPDCAGHGIEHSLRACRRRARHGGHKPGAEYAASADCTPRQIHCTPHYRRRGSDIPAALYSRRPAGQTRSASCRRRNQELGKHARPFQHPGNLVVCRGNVFVSRVQRH